MLSVRAEALFLHGWRLVNKIQENRSPFSVRTQVKEELHLFRCKNIPGAVYYSLCEAAGQVGYLPRGDTAGYIRKGAAQNGANWVWQEKENGAVIWWTGLDRPSGYTEIKFYQALLSGYYILNSSCSKGSKPISSSSSTQQPPISTQQAASSSSSSSSSRRSSSSSKCQSNAISVVRAASLVAPLHLPG